MHQFLENGIRHFKHRFAQGALILIYHRIHESQIDPWSLSVTPEHFAEHLAVLRRSFHSKSLQEVGQSVHDQAKLADRSIVITFDDGYADNLHTALPLLEQFDIPATIFVTTGAIGSQHEFWWDELASILLSGHPLPDRLEITISGSNYSWDLGNESQYQEVDESQDQYWKVAQSPPSFRHSLYLQLWHLINRLSAEDQRQVMSILRDWAGDAPHAPTHRIMDRNEVARLAQSGLIEIGAHAINHVPLASLSCAAQQNEIVGSKTQVEDMINQPVTSFSYPFGKQSDYQTETIALVQEAGFTVACCNESGVVRSGTDRFQLPRIHIHDCGGDEFESRLVSKFHVRN